jgi:solute carrier family 35 protein E1
MLSVSPAFAETIKSSEPLTTVLIGYLVLNERSSIRTYLTLIPICFGIAISCYHNDAFNFGGMILAAISNVCFSGRAVLAKKLNKQFPEGIDDIQMFANISLKGLYLLLPITLLFEGSSLYSFLQTGLTNTPSSSNGKEDNSTFLLFFFLFINGLVFACYNLVSYLVLRRTDLITHSVFNAFRRVFIIIFTTLYFGFPLSQNNIIGISIAVVGVLLFGYYRSMDTAPKSAK